MRNYYTILRPEIKKHTLELMNEHYRQYVYCMKTFNYDLAKDFAKLYNHNLKTIGGESRNKGHYYLTLGFSRK